MAEEGKGEEKESWQQRTRRRARKRLAICRVRLARRFRSPWTWTFVYLVCLVFYLFGALVFGGHVKFANMTPNNVGDFLAGAAAPLAFFWLVWGYHLQREELKLQRRELADTRGELRNQAQQQQIFANAMKLQTDMQIIKDLRSVMISYVRQFAYTAEKYKLIGYIKLGIDPMMDEESKVMRRIIEVQNIIRQSKKEIISYIAKGITIDGKFSDLLLLEKILNDINYYAESYISMYKFAENRIYDVSDGFVSAYLRKSLLDSTFQDFYIVCRGMLADQPTKPT